MRHEVIKLTDECFYPELIKLLDDNGPLWDDLRRWNKDSEKILFFGGFWTRIFPPYKSDYTITDTEFIQKYGNTDQSDKEPAWTFKTDEELAEMMIAYHDQVPSKRKSALDFLTSIRKPAFELITADNVKVTDPLKYVFRFDNNGKIFYCPASIAGDLCFFSREAALAHRLHTTPAIKLSDMFDDRCGYYQIAVEKAEKLVNERINGTK